MTAAKAEVRRSKVLTLADFDDLVRKERAGQKEQAEEFASQPVRYEPDSWDAKDAASAYEVRGGSLGWFKPEKGGSTWTPLATFDAEITQETIRDDGAEQTLMWTLRVTTPAGPEGETQITPDQLGKPQQWAAKAVGVSALVMPGLAMADHLRVAVQSRSTAVTRKMVYAHTGWRQIDGQLGVPDQHGSALQPTG